MALSGSTVFEVRTAGNDTNGGGFVTGAAGTNYSLQNSKNTTGADISTTDAVAAGTAVITSITANFGTTIVGNIIYLQGGTGSLVAGWYQVISRASTTSITVDRTVAAGTGITMNIGGALLSPAVAASLSTVAGMNTYIKNDGTAFSITTASTNVAGGAFTTSQFVSFIGYSTNRTPYNTDTQPTIQTNASTVTQIAGTNGLYMNIIFDGNNQTASRQNNSGTFFFNCMFKNFNTISAGSSSFYVQCQATTNSAGVLLGTCYYCEAFANTATPYSSIYTYGCLAYNNTGVSTNGFAPTGNDCTIQNCIAYGNGAAGFSIATSSIGVVMNCHAENNTGFGFVLTSGMKLSVNNSAFNNTAGAVSNSANGYFPTGFITPSGSVFVNAASSNFGLNNTSGAGALLRAAGQPATFPAGLTSNFRDIGAMQHQDPSGAASILIHQGMQGGCNG